MGDALHILPVAFEIDVLAAERLQRPKFRFGRQISFGPIIDRLPADEDIRLSIRIVYLEDLGELLEGKAHSYGHLAIARAT